MLFFRVEADLNPHCHEHKHDRMCMYIEHYQQRNTQA